mgnify:FL=1
MYFQMRVRPFCSTNHPVITALGQQRLFIMHSSTKSSTVGLLSESEWKQRCKQHEERFEAVVAPHARRRSRHEENPVADFLFEYYAFRPSHLRKWSPGLGIILKGPAAERFLDREHFEVGDLGVRVSLSNTPKHFERGTRWILNLLQSTRNRAPQFGCFGLHEWAMLYKADTARHASVQLRVSQNEVNEVVENGTVNCSHYDAFRFFTPDARPLNSRQLDRDDMTNCEQPGCLHANMDMYRWAFKRYPWIDSDLIMDAFELAMEIRVLDMASSPYDVSAYGIDPVPIEADHGRQQYISQQKKFAERASSIRDRLIEAYQNIVIELDALHGSFANSGSNS